MANQLSIDVLEGIQLSDSGVNQKDYFESIWDDDAVKGIIRMHKSSEQTLPDIMYKLESKSEEIRQNAHSLMSEKVNCFSPDVANLLAMWYVCSSTQQDYRLKATIWLRANANRHNHAKSQYDLSVLLTGEDNEEERIKWLMRAVDNKYPPALYKHGFELLSLGDADGIQFIEKSLKTDSLTADHFYKAGEAYTHGLYHLQVNLDRGKKLYVKAAKKGSVEAQVLLGNKYFEGEPNFFDLAQAINWYKMAAFKYNEEARLQLQCIRTMDEFRGRRMLAKLVCKFFDLKTHIENQATDYFWLLIIAFIFIGIPLLLIVGLIKWLMS